MVFISIGERVVLGAAEVTKDVFNLFSVNFTWVAEKLRKGGNSKGDVRLGSNSSIH